MEKYKIIKTNGISKAKRKKEKVMTPGCIVKRNWSCET
jgi:hypothetical protein